MEPKGFVLGGLEMEEKKSRILIVDDEPDIVDTLKHFLSVKGYETFGALNGKEALEVLEKSPADLVLLDILMPELSGTEVAKIAKAKFPNTKIIIVTGYPSQGQNLSNDKLSDALLIKPVRLDELYKKLMEVLSKKQTPGPEPEKAVNLKARVLFVKAKLLFVGPNIEAYSFLSNQLRELVTRGQNYELNLAHNEKELMQKITLLNPDVVIFDLQYFNGLDAHLTERIFKLSGGPKELILSDWASSASDSNELGKLIESIRLLCIKKGLIEIKWVEI